MLIGISSHVNDYRLCWSLNRSLGIALARFTVEYFREPDEQLQEFALRTGLSMGQWLTLPLMAVGLFFMVRALVRPALGSVPPPPA